jgi:hypothetical protein
MNQGAMQRMAEEKIKVGFLKVLSIILMEMSRK